MYSNDRGDARGSEWLDDAVAERARIILHAKTVAGWADWKSRLLATGEGNLRIACPPELLGRDSTVTIGQLIGVSLRHGHKKCMFDSEIIDQDPDTGDLLIRRPSSIQEMQRRVFSRVRVPDHLTIPVNVNRLATDGVTDVPSVPRRGILLDLSGGGMSVAVPTDARNKWRPGDTMRCLLPLEPAQEPRELTARVRFVEKTALGHLRMGMQFIGLEGSAEGRTTLKCIARATGRFRNAAASSSSNW